KVDRADARIEEVVGESTDLLLGLASDLAEEMDDIDVDAVLDVPVVYASAKAGRASTERPADGTLPDETTVEPLFRTIIESLQAHVTNLDASPFLGRLALLRIKNGQLTKGQQVAWCTRDGETRTVKVTELLETKGLQREAMTRTAGPGDIVAVAGIPEIMIGE